MIKKNKRGKKNKKQRGGSQCYSTECAANALKVINDKNALVPLNEKMMDFPLPTRQMNVKQKGGGSTNVWRKIGLAKPNDLMNDIFDGISNVKNTFLGNEVGSTSDTLEHPIADNEKILMNNIKGSDKLTIDAYIKAAELPITISPVQKKQLGSGKKRRKSRRKSQRKSRKKIKKSKKRRSKKVRKTKKRRKSRRK